ncbi:MAG: hypothetical protein ABI345_14190 [Jatrophihabitans sp.]
MPVRETLTERKNKMTEASREQFRAYIGANDGLYDRLRRFSPDGQERSQKLGDIKLRDAVKSMTPAKLKESVEQRMAAARARHDKNAARGAQITQDWHKASAVKDAKELVKTVKSADGAGELVKGVRTWVSDYPTWVSAPKPRTGAKVAKPRPRKAAKTVPAAKKAAKTAPAAKKAPARTTTPRAKTAPKTAPKAAPKNDS